jgi:hypothetical protein
MDLTIAVVAAGTTRRSAGVAAVSVVKNRLYELDITFQKTKFVLGLCFL